MPEDTSTETGTTTTETGTEKPGAAAAKEFKAIESQDDLDRIVQNRVARERDKFKDHDAYKEKALKFDELEEKQKSELQRATDRATELEGKATEAELRALRLEVAVDKGLTPTQAKRLVGKNKEELESDADDLIASFKDEGKSTATPPSGKPKERLVRGGGDPNEEPEESDYREVAKKISRDRF